ncbi:MAG: MlaD family protein, partial [Cyanobacteria bacterium P01_H01_bin.58]
MRARAIREGSVGLLILVGIGLFGGLVLWLRGLTPGGRNYSITVSFENTSGMQIGAAVRYRGVRVGRVVDIRAGSNAIDVLVEITQPDLRIPNDVIVEANQSGFIGETTIDITPENTLSETEQALNPTTEDCDSSIIVCEGDRLEGIVGVSYESLLRSTESLADTLSDPVLVEDLKATLKNAALFTESATTLTDELTTLTLAAQDEVEPLSTSVQNATNSAAEAARTIQLTAADAQSLIAANQFNITNTLENLNQGSDRLVFIMDTLATEVQDNEFLANLETLSANAAEASFSLRSAATDIEQITGSVNQAENLLLIQQTLESARDVFQGAQKVLSDVD